MTVSHLQFADDTINFCKADVVEVLVIKRILRCFQLVSGLKINFHKSFVCGVGVPTQVVMECASRLNCKSQSLPFLYLGLPLGASPRLKKTWKPIIDKGRVKLASWKRKLLSFGGRLTLIKSVLSSLPVYYLSIFKMPQSVIMTIDHLRAAFLWVGLN